MLRKAARAATALILVLSMAAGTVCASADLRAAKKAKLSSKKIYMEAGEKKTIVIKNKKRKAKYSFVSKNKKIAKVSKKGKVTAVKEGIAKIAVKETLKGVKKARSLGTVKVIVRKAAKNNAGGGAAAQGQPQAGAGQSGTPQGDNLSDVLPSHSNCIDIDFADGDISKFSPEGEGVKIELAAGGYDDNACIKATGRAGRNDWFGCGMALDITGAVQPGKTYKLTCYVKCDADATMTIRSINGNGGGGFFNFPSQVGQSVSVKAGEWTRMEAVYLCPDAVNGTIRLYWDASSTSDIYLDSIQMAETTVLDDTFKTLFTDIFGHVGVSNTYAQMRDYKGFTTTLYNSVTMENETKPLSLLNARNISDSPPAGYVIPKSYIDAKYPVIDFSTIDNVINTAYEYGLSIRFHVLVWHSQTPAFFFMRGYDEANGYTTKAYMDGRLEYYIRNVMEHIYNTPHGRDVVYCIDVANEYFHNYDQGSKSAWNAIYYPDEKSESDRTNKPEYVKRAFEIAYDELEKLGLTGSVKLFYNDYNTYEVTDDIITMINYINAEKKICDGVGMQSHLDVDYPAPGMGGKIADTIDAFTAQGYEIQITELDVTDYDNSGKQEQYYADLINMLVTKKKNGANITGLTFWGLCDSNSWRRDGKPLLFGAVFSPKPAFYKFIEAAKAAWGK